MKFMFTKSSDQLNHKKDNKVYDYQDLSFLEK
jgi:hypothetical protein